MANVNGSWETFAKLVDTVWENIAAPVKWTASKFGSKTEVSKRKLKSPMSYLFLMALMPRI